MNSPEVKKRVSEFVAKAYASALAKIKNQNDEDLANLKERLGRVGHRLSDETVLGAASLWGLPYQRVRVFTFSF